MTAVERLIDLELERRPFPTRPEILNRLENPSWDASGRVHDWRNHVPQNLVNVWADLSIETRAAIYFIASEAASEEKWDYS